MLRRLAPVPLAALAACAAPPPANPEFSDAAAFAFVEFDDERPENLAFALRAFERQLYLSFDVEAESAADRAVSPAPLSEEDVAGIPHPDADPANALAVGVGRASEHDVDDHVAHILLDDQVPVEPGSPDHYDRTFDEGRDCFEDRSCEFLRTTNNLTKDNILLTITYDLNKDYRWIDLTLPDPADVPVGEVAVGEDPPRWALMGRSWTEEVAEGQAGNTAILQSYTVEVWLPRDGRGYVRAEGDANADGGAWTADSTGGGVLRSMILWNETDLGDLEVSDELVVNTTRGGIDDIFVAQEEWMDAN